ncbi:MAG: T9SS type A sorting domain-containing protein, partial [Candidatus Marinimicrobia bacterium]|nr:T9SS type A sorting domain-containing protein [Candidatus Neomarinimicrobiota bacterium]
DECYSITNTTWLGRINEGLTGEIPSEIGQLTNLVTLKLQYNELTGSIPPEIGNLTSLVKLDLRYNNLSGSIPTEVWSLISLKELGIQKNQFSGTIPSAIGNLTELTHLYLYGNQFTGSIPAEIGNLINVWKLHLNNNQFTGLIPETICNIDMSFYNPYSFDISGNQLLPPYPDCVAEFVGYQYSEDCESNYLFDGICTEQSDLDVLQKFIDNSSETINMEMDDNNNGIIEPIELGTQHWWDGRLTELNCNYDLANEFTLSDLGLSGEIPQEIGTLDSLEFLWLEDNQLTGPIPSEIGNLSKLKYLIMHHNQLSDSIPSEIGNLSNLEILKLDNNQLTGYIPESICDLTLQFNGWNNLFGEDFAVYNNQLCAPYPDCVDAYVGLQNTTNCELASDTFNPIPLDYSLYDPYPNPFNAQTTIQITLPIKDVMIVKVYDVNGSELKTLVHSIFDSGTHTIKWDAGDLPSGIYFIRMQTRHFVDTKKVSLIK